MSQRIVVVGGKRLSGEIPVNGSKNAAVALLAGSILASEGVSVIRNLPCIGDMATLADVLRYLGVRVTFSDNGHTATIDATELQREDAPAELVARMRASFWVLGPVLARRGRARVAQPGGCNIGARAIDLHIKGLTALGAKIDFVHGDVAASAGDGGLAGASIYLDMPSVGATMNIMMAASLTPGTTIIENAAQEPDVEDLGNYLVAMGARIHGQGTGVITIEGVSALRGCAYRVMPDRIEAGTYAVAAGITGGRVFLRGANPIHIRPITMKMNEIGMGIEEAEDGVWVSGPEPGTRLRATRLTAMPHPGFPTDMQQPFSAALSIADGTSTVTDQVYESRFRYLTELGKMGARARVDGRTAVITGIERLSGADVEATDLRAGAALVVAALAADGQTRISGTEHLDRGYEGLVDKLRGVGANIWREDEFGKVVVGPADEMALCSA